MTYVVLFLAALWAGMQNALAGGVSGAADLSFRALVAISLVGGGLGAGLLLVTSASFFARLVPWLVLFATCVFAWGSFVPRTHARG